ncbi:MAG: hypothetical protein IPJ41_14115 [Phycisphaerales bacterium]|nr:hypothetical protein [Phycisphaerales bacterium]
MLQTLLGAISLAAICALWGLWQRFADRVDPRAASDRRAGGRCCVPHPPTHGNAAP